jgi:cell division protease FtsH
VFKASILSRGGALGVVYPQPKAEYHSFTRETFIADIKTSLAGYVAEKIKYGTTTSGVSADFRNAATTAHAMVWNVGMGKSGIIGDYTAIPENLLSEETKTKLNNEVNDILQDSLKDVEELLTKEWLIVDEFAKELLEKEELDFDEIDAIFAKHGKSNSIINNFNNK